MAYAALLLYVAILFIRPQEWVQPLEGAPIEKYIIGVALATWLGSLMVSRWRPKDAPQNWLMLGLFSAVLLSHMSHMNFGATVNSFVDFGKIVLVYLLVSSLLTDVGRAKGLIFVMVVSCLFMAADGWSQRDGGTGITGTTPLVLLGQVRVRSTGIFNDPNDLALILVAVLPFLVTDVWRPGHNGIVRLLSAAACLPIVACIFLTNSRGGWLALGVMLMAYTAVHMRRRKLGIIVAVLVMLVVFSVGPARMGALSTSEGSAHGRILSWGSANEMLKANPIFGVGYDYFTEYSATGLVAHNSFAQCWAELGMVGYFFWLALVIATFKDSWALANATGEDPKIGEFEQLGKTLFAAFAGYMAAALFLSRTYVVPLYLMFGLVAALRGTYEHEYGPLAHAFCRKDLRWVAVVAVVSVPALWLFIRISG